MRHARLTHVMHTDIFNTDIRHTYSFYVTYIACIHDNGFGVNQLNSELDGLKSGWVQVLFSREEDG